MVTDEIKVGDNDTLGALVANLDRGRCAGHPDRPDQGLYSADPRKDPDAKFIHEAVAAPPELEQMAGGAGSSIGKGGMITRSRPRARSRRAVASTVIAWGRRQDALLRLVEGESIGTLLVAATQKVAAQNKQWMADHL